MRLREVFIWCMAIVAVLSGRHQGAHAQTVYLCDSRALVIRRANMNCHFVAEDLITSGLEGPSGIALDPDEGMMYWADTYTQKIQRTCMDGSGFVEDLVTTGLGQPSGIALDMVHRKVYWTDMQTSKIQCANLDGSEVEDVVTGAPSSAIAIDAEEGKVYWADFITLKIRRAGLDGTAIEDLVSDAFSFGLALDTVAGKIYWTDHSGNRIRRTNLDGSGGVENVVTTNVIAPYGLGIDPVGGKVYWTEIDTYQVHWANLDGTDSEVIPSPGLGHPVGIAVYSPPRVIQGDMDGDGLISGADIQLFVDKLLNPEVKISAGRPHPSTDAQQVAPNAATCSPQRKTPTLPGH